MNAKTTRILKEARALLWPWCAVTIAGVLPLVHHQSGSHGGWTGWPLVHEGIPVLGFFAGIPLLATLSLGNEFQHRTVSLLLTQPVSRTKIWGEKLSVTIVAVLSAALVFCYSWRSAFQQNPKLWVFAGAYVITIIASATFWTLFARSTMGGLALNINLAYFVILGPVLAYSTAEEWEEILGNLSPGRLWTVAFPTLCYAGVMLWLGGRKLARFQVTGGMAGDDLLMAGPSVMPEALAGLFRCRPTGPFLNLIRKELRLLRPLWLITLLTALGWTCLTMFRLLPKPGQHFHPSLALMVLLGPVFMLPVLIAILAGSLPVGEERTAGTHSWHMSLPVSARRQWLIKLVVAVFSGFVGAVLLPNLVMIAGGWMFGSPYMFVDPGSAMDWLLIVLVLISVSFWCACAVNGTARAALWVGPAAGALFLAIGYGDWVALHLSRTTGNLLDLVVSWFRIRPFYAVPDRPNMTWVLVPTLLFVVIQSCRLFRTQPEDSILSMTRRLLPLPLVAFLCSFSLGVSGFGFQPQPWNPFYETYLAMEELQPSVTNLAAANPLQLTVDDLAKSSRLSALTRRWLRHSNITVAPDPAHSGYLATIHLASGVDCRLAVGHFGGRPILGSSPCDRRSR